MSLSKGFQNPFSYRKEMTNTHFSKFMACIISIELFLDTQIFSLHHQVQRI